MTESENFKLWLETLYISDWTKKPLISAKYYVNGLENFSRKMQLPGYGIFEKDVDLNFIQELINEPDNWHKNLSSYFNAYRKYKDFAFSRANKTKKPIFRQPDIFKRQQVEIAAINKVIEHFENLNYLVISTEKDNVGWDLEAKNLKHTILIEVKGLSGKVLCVELTPNEYEKSKSNHESYKICIVTNSLSLPNLHIFSFDKLTGIWIDENGNKLIIEEKIAARFVLE